MIKGFDRYQLADRVLEALPKIGFKRPTEVQELVMPLMMQKRNLVVEAATGTGKTAAYALPILSRIDYTKRSTQVLILAPSRELALQVEAAFKSFTTNDRLRIQAVYGGMGLAESEKKVKSSPHIMVAVPGRLKDVLRSGKFDYFWRDIKMLVIDEADKLLELGFQDILDNLVSNVRNYVQVALFSATISEDVELLIKERFHPLQTIRLSPQQVLRSITFNYIVVDQGQKERYLAGLIQAEKIKQALIFSPQRDEVYDVANFLRSMGFKAEAYHGLLDQVERVAIMKRFKKRQVDFLVATDLAARGLDVVNLPCVINYAFPDEKEVYLHRCGRTGRAGKKGKVYNLVASKKEEILVESYHAQLEIALKGYSIEPIRKEQMRNVENKILKVHFNRGKRDKVGAGDIVGFLVNSCGVKADKVGTIAVYDTYVLADIPDWALDVLQANSEAKIKGKSVKVTKYSLTDQKKKAAAMKKSQVGVRDKKEIVNREQLKADRKAGVKRKTRAEVEKEKEIASKKKSSKKAVTEKGKIQGAHRPKRSRQ